MREIAQRLGAEQWAIIDLTLKQFDLPWTNEWNGTGRSNEYVIDMIAGAPDQTLIELAKHLGYTLEVLAPSHVEPAFWRKGMFRLFVSV